MATGQARGVKTLHKLDWLILDNRGRVLVEVQRRRGDISLYRSALIEKAADPRPYGGAVNQAMPSGTYHLTNYGKGLAAEMPDATGPGGYCSPRENLRSYLAYSHGPDFRAATERAQAIVPVPAGYVPGSFTL